MPNTLNCLTMRIKSIYCSAVFMEMIETIELNYSYKKQYCRQSLVREFGSKFYIILNWCRIIFDGSLFCLIFFGQFYFIFIAISGLNWWLQVEQGGKNLKFDQIKMNFCYQLHLTYWGALDLTWSQISNEIPQKLIKNPWIVWSVQWR